MNFRFYAIAAIGLIFSNISASAQTDTSKVYVFLENMPDAGIYLPAPPDTSSLEYADDVIQWQWGKTVRNTPRGAMANRDGKWGHEIMAEIYSGVFGFTICEDSTPAIWKLLVKASYTGHFSTTKAKRKYMRTRPFAQFNEHTWSEFDDDEELRHNGSYPSGHTSLSWSMALVFAEMVPELQDTILRRAYQYAESRVIVGAHYQSDIEAGRLAASAGVASIHTSPFFLADLQAARAEYNRIKGLKNTPIINAMPDGRKILDSPVDTISRRFYGDVAQYWQSKAERGTERGRQAIADADGSIDALLAGFSVPAGFEISQKATPALAAMLQMGQESLSANANQMKTTAFRKRPYVQFGEPTLIPEAEDSTAQTSSYLSVTAEVGWGLALLLAEIVPERQNEILTRGFEYGRSRVIAGYNYASDVQASRVMATCVVAHLHADAKFSKLVEKAKKEYGKRK